jgi:hypothetical protein
MITKIGKVSEETKGQNPLTKEGVIPVAPGRF